MNRSDRIRDRLWRCWELAAMVSALAVVGTAAWLTVWHLWLLAIGAA